LLSKDSAPGAKACRFQVQERGCRSSIATRGESASQCSLEAIVPQAAGGVIRIDKMGNAPHPILGRGANSEYGDDFGKWLAGGGPVATSVASGAASEAAAFQRSHFSGFVSLCVTVRCSPSHGLEISVVTDAAADKGQQLASHNEASAGPANPDVSWQPSVFAPASES